MTGSPRVLVFGAGAIGQWIGARVADAGAAVTLLCREEASRAITARGVTVKTAQGRVISAPVQAAAHLRALTGASFDWVFITTKAFGVAPALRELHDAGLLGGDTAVMGFQNGVGTEDAIAAAVSPARTAVCVVTRPIALAGAPGEVCEASPRGGIAIAPYTRESRPAHFGSLEAPLARCGLPVTRFDDYRVMKWSKLLLNMTANATCAILDCSPAAVFDDPALYAIERSALREAIAVMDALGVRAANFPGYPAATLARVIRWLPAGISRLILRERVGSARGMKPPSLRLEMERPRPESEVHWLNGAVASKAAEQGLEAPVNAFLTETLDAIVCGRTPWDVWRGQPDTLAAAIRERAS